MTFLCLKPIQPTLFPVLVTELATPCHLYLHHLTAVNCCVLALRFVTGTETAAGS